MTEKRLMLSNNSETTMKNSDVLKVLFLLALAAVVVGLICHARVDLGLSLGQMANRLQHWTSDVGYLALAIWMQILVAVVFGIGYRILKHQASRDTGATN